MNKPKSHFQTKKQAENLWLPGNKDMLLTERNKSEVLRFLKIRSVHTIMMTSFINDNGLENTSNRGKFYGYRNFSGSLEGIALIGHTTLIKAHSEKAIEAFARIARESETPIHFMMSEGNTIENFWHYYVESNLKPRKICTEKLFKISNPPAISNSPERQLRLAEADEVFQIAIAHAEIAELESGINPLKLDTEGFLSRTLKRIARGRTWVVFENGELLFKADVVAENAEAMYLEGVYVNPKLRGQGIATKCLQNLCKILLNKVKHICLLSNVEFTRAHRAYLRAGFQMQETYQTIFI